MTPARPWTRPANDVCAADGTTAGRLLAWALGVNVSDYTYARRQPTLDEVKGWIDAGRPVMLVLESESRTSCTWP